LQGAASRRLLVFCQTAVQPVGFILCNKDAVGTISRVGITVQQFERMKGRIHSVRKAMPAFEQAPRSAASAAQVILGVDPSLRGTGYGVICTAKPYPRTLAQGTISCPPAWEHSRCLASIARVLREVIQQNHPDVCIIEGLFFAQNLKTALIMGEARGAALATIGEAGLEIYEIAPRKVKQAIVGYGAAQKLAVAKMVQRLLNLPEPPEPDAADALALALTHAQASRLYSLSTSKRV
jgi:crossover junction endodeoxyribonuclease RuvC